MRQLLVECSDPGLVVSLAEELENVLRHIDFAQALALRDQLGALAGELGPETAAAWRGFRLEQPNDGGWPPAFGSREAMDGEQPALESLLAQATERGLGRFELRSTLLLPQDGPAPETREQYIADLADAIRWEGWPESGVYTQPVGLPQAMAAHREHLVNEHAVPVLRGRARVPAVGFAWRQDTVEAVRKALDEVDIRAEAVMAYELGRLDPADVEPGERLRWAALAVRMGDRFEQWCPAAEASYPHLHQRAALLWEWWQACRGWGRARAFLDQGFTHVIEEAGTVYTADAVAALRRIHDDLHRDGLGRLFDPLPGGEVDDEGDDGLLF